MTTMLQDSTERADENPMPPSAPSLRVVTVGMLTLVTLIAFEAMAVATAMPATARALSAVGSYGLAISAFLAMSLFGTVVSGYWGDRSGPRAPLLTGLAGFTGGLVVSGLAPSFVPFVVGRAIGGFGAGLVAVSIYVLIGKAYPADRRPKIFAWFSAAWVLPAVIGPALAGWLTEAVSWRVIFLGVPPIAIPAALALLPALSSISGGTGQTWMAMRPWRRIGAGAGVAVAVTVMLWGAENLGTATGIAATVIGGLALVGTLAILLPAGTVALRRGLPSLVASRGMLTMSFFGADTFIPLMLVTHRGLSPVYAGVALTSGALGWSAGAWLQARIRTDAAHAKVLGVGASVVGLGSALLAVIVLGLPTWAVAVAWVLAGLGMGAAMSSGSVLLLNLSSPTEQGKNSSYLQLADSFGGVLGVGLAGAIFAAAHAQGPVGSGVYSAIWLVLALAGIGAAFAGRRTARRG